MPNCAFLSKTSPMIAIFRALQDRRAAARIAVHGGTLLTCDGLEPAGAAHRVSQDEIGHGVLPASPAT
jgi:hypothetical protein